MTAPEGSRAGRPWKKSLPDSFGTGIRERPYERGSSRNWERCLYAVPGMAERLAIFPAHLGLHFPRVYENVSGMRILNSPDKADGSNGGTKKLPDACSVVI